MEVGTNNSVWSSLALVKTLIATMPSPPGTILDHDRLSPARGKTFREHPGGDIDSGAGPERQDEPDRTLRIALGGGAGGAVQDGEQRGNPEQDQSRHDESFLADQWSEVIIGGDAGRARWLRRFRSARTDANDPSRHCQIEIPQCSGLPPRHAVLSFGVQ